MKAVPNHHSSSGCLVSVIDPTQSGTIAAYVQSSIRNTTGRRARLGYGDSYPSIFQTLNNDSASRVQLIGCLEIVSGERRQSAHEM